MAGEDPTHLARIRAERCAVASACWGRIEAHHPTHGRGLSQRSHDHEAIPLCMRHHSDFHKARGYFFGWHKQARQDWQRRQSAIYRPKKNPGVF
jgi:hypothetical protein